jgi:predicted Zn-dependent protease
MTLWEEIGQKIWWEKGMVIRFASRSLFRSACLCLFCLGLVLSQALHPTRVQGQVIEQLIGPGIQLLQLSRVTAAQEVQMGQQIEQQLLRQGYRLYSDPQLSAYVTQVGQRLARESKRPNIPYQFQLLQDQSINAFATMGGFVYVTTGLLNAADNEAQLASVMAHEVGHIEGQHVLKQMRETALAQGLLSAAGLDRNAAASIGTELAFKRPRSRQDEFDADQRGLQILTRAVYEPTAMPVFMGKLLNQRSGSSLLSTHPAVRDRIASIQIAIQSLPDNGCRQNPEFEECGLNQAYYQQTVRERLPASF